MPLLPILILALVQGITEFLPVSSSGHLVLLWDIFARLGWSVAARPPAERLIIDIAVHIGTLGAVMAYFHAEVRAMIRGLGQAMGGGRGPERDLLLAVVMGSLPLALFGLLLKDLVTGVLRDPAIAVQVVAWATIGFGILLYVADRAGGQEKGMDEMTPWAALAIGAAQVLALIPGTSRSGITMTAARALGFQREAAARFSMLLAMPAILAAGALAVLELARSGDLSLGLDAVLAAGLSFGFALVAIAWLLRWLRSSGFLPFVIYRLGLGALILYWLA